MTASRLAWASMVLSSLASLVALGIAIYGAVTSGDYHAFLSHQAVTPFLAVGFTGIGALVAARLPRNPTGWMFVTVGFLFTLTALAAALYEYSPQTSLIRLWATWFGTWVWIPAVFLPGLYVRLFFPDGRLLSRRWSLVAWPAAIGLATIVLAVMLHSDSLSDWGLPANPFGIPGSARFLMPALFVGAGLLAVGYIGSWGALFARFRSSSGPAREQLKWLVYATGLDLLFGLLGSLAGVLWPKAAWTFEISILASDLGILAIVVAAAIAILRYRLYDIDLVINRTLVYGALTAGVAALYLIVAGGLGVLLQARDSLGLSLLGVGMVVVAAQPMRDRLQRAVNRLMYGERDDPYAVLSHLGSQMEATLAPKDVLTQMAETIGRMLKLPYIAITLGAQEQEPAAVYGRPAPIAVRLPLSYQSENVGALLVAARGPAESFTPTEEHLLEDIARQTGMAVHAAGLTAALQLSRERLVSAREEERRRLRRDLHDGLGPTLASHAYRLDTVLDLIDHDPAAAKRLIGDLKVQTQTTLADIRRLVYELRPPALDELGLAAALQAQFTDTARGLRIQVEVAPDPLPMLSAAVEVAAFRIAAEAVTNTVRHARAKTCLVRLSAGDATLCVQVDDDGAGLPPRAKPGVGLVSMRERAAELGGTCTIGPGPAGGTRVLAHLPLPRNEKIP